MFELEIISDAFGDALNVIPLLLAIYIVIGLAEHKFGDFIITNVKKAGRAGPLIGALAGIFPQCGFSVIATALYTQKLVTVGTLLAVYLATSDEALPIILSQPGKIGAVFLLIMTKLAIALPAGYAVDFAFRKRNEKVLDHIAIYSSGKDDKSHHHETALMEPACCGHRVDAASKKFKPADILFHPIIHTLKIFLFIFAVTLAINVSVDRIGSAAIENLFSANAFLAPFLAALIGLIPNCAASVVITELYLKGVISYGAAISGLCASAGLGTLVLIKDDKEKNDVVLIIAMLLGISIASGLVIQYLMANRWFVWTYW